MKTERTIITGGSGMVGKALHKLLPHAVALSSRDCDLRDDRETRKMFQSIRPKYVYHLAAKVGGLGANLSQMSDFYEDNIRINTNTLIAARECGAEKCVSLLSTCVYPDKVTYPLTEDQIHNGPPHSSNYGYAYAKRMLDIQSRAMRSQHGTKFITAVPNNLYGEHDNFHLEDSHVIPAIMRKVWEAKKENKEEIYLWGDGSPVREFTYAPDVALALLYLMEKYNGEEPINIGNTEEISIKEVAEKICDELDFHGKRLWQTDKPNGQHRKPSSNAKFCALGWSPGVYRSFSEGLRQTCVWFKSAWPNVRGVR